MRCISCKSENLISHTDDELRGLHLLVWQCLDCDEWFDTGYDVEMDGELTAEEILAWKELYERQNGCCAGCERHQAELNGTLCLDKDLTIGMYTGLLCITCFWKMSITKNGLTREQNYKKFRGEKDVDSN